MREGQEEAGGGEGRAAADAGGGGARPREPGGQDRVHAARVERRETGDREPAAREGGGVREQQALAPARARVRPGQPGGRGQGQGRAEQAEEEAGG